MCVIQNCFEIDEDWIETTLLFNSLLQTERKQRKDTEVFFFFSAENKYVWSPQSQADF